MIQSMKSGMCKWMGWEVVGAQGIFDAVLAERICICGTIELLTQRMI